MCIASDFAMYYSDSYVGIQEGDVIVPFLVANVDYQSWMYDRQQETGERMSTMTNRLYEAHEEIVSSLRFSGYKLDPDGRRINATVDMADLILENPRLGYIKVNGNWKWITYAPQQSAKKGLSNRRLSYHGLERMHIYELFNIKPDGERLNNDLVLTSRGLGYKGVIIGSYDGNTVTVSSEFSHLQKLLGETLPEGTALNYE